MLWPPGQKHTIGDIGGVDPDLDHPADWKGSKDRPRRRLGLAEADAVGVVCSGVGSTTRRIGADKIGPVGRPVAIGLFPQFTSDDDTRDRRP